MSIYAVNGKEPIAAWIPSLDTAGNGTTTLTDLVGSNNGTLTNMDPATDWVADIGAGGVRALDFNSVNNYVATPLFIAGALAKAASVWFKTTGTVAVLLGAGGGGGGAQFRMRIESGVFFGRFGSGNSLSAGSGLNDGNWHHVVMAIPESSQVSNVLVWIDGSLRTTSTFGSATINISSNTSVEIGAETFQTTARMAGRLDDIRVWDIVPVAADVTALYASGLGRGITFVGTTIQTRRRRDLGGFGL